jgi:hypothetical protein
MNLFRRLCSRRSQLDREYCRAETAHRSVTDGVDQPATKLLTSRILKLDEGRRRSEEKRVETGAQRYQPGPRVLCFRSSGSRNGKEPQDPYKKRPGEKPATYGIGRSLGGAHHQTVGRCGSFVSGEQLCFGDLVISGMSWIVQREFVLQSPGEDRNGQPNEDKAEPTETRTICV